MIFLTPTLTLLSLSSFVRNSLIAALLLTGCVSDPEFSQPKVEEGFDPETNRFSAQVVPEFARGFSVTYHNYFKEVNLHDVETGELLHTLYLVDRGAEVPDSLDKDRVVFVPIEKATSISTTHLPMIDKIDQLGTVKGFAAFDYLNNADIRERINEQGVVDLGSGGAIDEEKLLEIFPDVNFTYYFENTDAGMRKNGVLHVPVGEYLEVHPLGAAEWLKFFALFYNQEQAANEYFSTIRKLYEIERKAAQGYNDRPSVFVGVSYKDEWFMPGGNSYSAQLIEDAGGDYVLADNASYENVAMDFETVMDKCLEVEYWLIVTYFNGSPDRDGLKNMDRRYARFDAFKNEQIYVCNLSEKDYFGEALIEPHVMLRDLRMAFHKEEEPETIPVYFENMP